MNFSTSCVLHWCVLGDFNALLGSHEKMGTAPLPIACDELRQAIVACHLVKVDIKGVEFI